MSEFSTSRLVVVQNREGLHARPAHMLAQLAARFQAEIQIVRDGEGVDGKSILSILMLAAEQGTELNIRARGPDAEAAVESLARLFEQGFSDGPDGPAPGDTQPTPPHPAAWTGDATREPQ